MAEAKTVRCDDDSVVVDLQDGRTLAVPLVWFPTLLAASPEERADVVVMTGGDGLRWERLDLDLSVAAMLEGRRERVAPRAVDAA
jgi:hypothetical protein